ncbi:unnamed protein product [Rotaria magnacalcarata]|uniref:Uncharacterized protein n=1 Tax=Rotaria magnacalcarata TaxID=392030 RepID=A0A816V6R2_9BILA|nr:unnamed protein product [Rotaria magnacalcarata]
MFYLIISFNQPIDYLNPRPEYIRVVIIEWSIKFSIPIARTFSLDTQSSLISARRCKDLDGIYILELTYEMFYLIISFNRPIDYLNPRPEYIRVIIIEWSIKFSIPIARTVSLDTQRSLTSARRCKDLDGYSQQVD